jgi:AraC-like DNA-binding protein
LFDLLNKELVEKHPNNVETTSLLCELIYTYFFRLDKSEETKSESIFANRIMYFLQHDNHFTQKVTLQEIADYAGYSKFYTSTMFHKLYGITIQQFIINLRIYKIKLKKLIKYINVNEYLRKMEILIYI